MLALYEVEILDMPQVCLPFAMDDKGQTLDKKMTYFMRITTPMKGQAFTSNSNIPEVAAQGFSYKNPSCFLHNGTELAVEKDIHRKQAAERDVCCHGYLPHGPLDARWVQGTASLSY